MIVDDKKLKQEMNDCLHMARTDFNVFKKRLPSMPQKLVDCVLIDMHDFADTIWDPTPSCSSAEWKKSQRNFVAVSAELMKYASPAAIDETLVNKSCFSRTPKSVPVIADLAEKASQQAIDDALGNFTQHIYLCRSMAAHVAPLLPKASKELVKKFLFFAAESNRLDCFEAALPHVSNDVKHEFICKTAITKNDTLEFVERLAEGNGHMVRGMVYAIAYEKMPEFVVAAMASMQQKHPALAPATLAIEVKEKS